ncbi:MAG: hypothetical protein ACE14L_16780 [Terriglobales bacterium]
MSAWLAGWRAGLLAAMFNLLGAAYCLLPPSGSLLIDDSIHALQLAVAALAMAAVVVFVRYAVPGREASRLRPISLRTDQRTESSARAADYGKKISNCRMALGIHERVLTLARDKAHARVSSKED